MDNDSQDVNKTSQVIKCTWGCCGHSGSLGGTVHVVKRDEVSQGAGIGRAGEKKGGQVGGNTLQCSQAILMITRDTLGLSC